MQDQFYKLFPLIKEDKLNKDNLDECLQLENSIRAAGIFSSNDDASDLNPSHIKYLMVDFMLASVLECHQNDRLVHLKMAHNYYLKFLSGCITYELIPKESLEFPELSRYFLEDKDADDVREERFEKWLKNVPRDLKIDRMKRIIRLKSHDIPESECECEDELSDIDALLWKDWIQFCVLVCLDKLGMLLREVELLESGRDGEISTITNQAKSENSNLTRIEKPFKLVKDRKQVASDVFKYGHNLPTMSIDEYLELERKRGNIITGGGAASAVKKEIDEDDEEAMEIELKKAREFDEFKDMYSRGSGNTYNRS